MNDQNETTATDAAEEVTAIVELVAGRKAVCSYMGSCKARQEKRGDTSYADGYDNEGRAWATSSLDLPFFKSRPDQETDEFFCGCFGWD